MSKRREEPYKECKRKYRSIKINGKGYLAHRLVFLLINNRFPYNQIDHIDHDRLNNHPDNLRDVTSSQNQRNRTLTKCSKSGYIGVTPCGIICKEKGTYRYWRASIKIKSSTSNRLRKTFPFTKSGKMLAVEWVKKKRIILGYHKNHGGVI